MFIEEHEYKYAPDGRILVDKEGYERWAEGQRRIPGVEKRARSIRIYFRDQAKACRESLYSSPANLKYATRLRQRICDDIRAGCVDYP